MNYRDCVVCGLENPEPLFRKDGYQMVRCNGCGLVYVGEDTSQIDFDALYDRGYYTGGSDSVFADYLGEEAVRRRYARRKLALLRHIPPRIARQGRLLDIGCAAGFFLAEARTHYEVQGVELSAWSSAYARDHLELPVFTGTLGQASLPADRFDVVTLWDVIEHVPDPVPLLAEAARVLRPGGRLVLSTGDFGSAYAQSQGAGWHLMTPPWHLTMFSRASLARAAYSAGLRVVGWRSEGVAGDGWRWRNRASLLLSRWLGLGDIVRLTLTK